MYDVTCDNCDKCYTGKSGITAGPFLNLHYVCVSTPGGIIPTFKSNPKYTNPNSITERLETRQYFELSDI